MKYYIEYPWQAVLVSYDTTESGMICGATVVDEYWILTAAHCVISPPEESYIFTGLTSLSNPQHTHRVERFVVHPGFDANLIINDIALVKEWSSLSRGTIMITDKQLCAGSKMHGTGPGDSGGPLLARDKIGRLVQLGITSFGAAGFQGLLDQSTYPG
ncbi:trypsin [Ancylostoma duodenale]|uniref:Trypsin n=1 Tax=Ancylostoma duodenale TaxID=51022 RepID=A0A0C2GV25_9BILA|nr:trypsin [Ancylostoma duodenale]